VHVNHLHGGELVEHGTRRKSRRQRFQSAAESGVQAIGEKGDENVRLDARLEQTSTLFAAGPPLQRAVPFTSAVGMLSLFPYAHMPTPS
jgi:hypothetical protein